MERGKGEDGFGVRIAWRIDGHSTAVGDSAQGCEDSREALIYATYSLRWGRVMKGLCHNCSRLFLEEISGLDPSQAQKLM
jgi:hypothetical protein